MLTSRSHRPSSRHLERSQHLTPCRPQTLDSRHPKCPQFPGHPAESHRRRDTRQLSRVLKNCKAGVMTYDEHFNNWTLVMCRLESWVEKPDLLLFQSKLSDYVVEALDCALARTTAFGTATRSSPELLQRLEDWWDQKVRKRWAFLPLPKANKCLKTFPGGGFFSASGWTQDHKLSRNCLNPDFC